MDFVSHMLLAYLAALWLGAGGMGGADGEYYMLFTVICGVFPDFDVILFPFGRYWHMLRHHGITHTVLSVLVVSAIGGLMMGLWLGMDPLLLFVLGAAGGLVHLFGDYFSNYSIPALYPFTGEQYKIDVDMAVNPYLLAFGATSTLVLWDFRNIGLDYSLYMAAVTAVSLMFAGYLVFRLVLKLVSLNAARRMLGHRRGRIITLPTTNPLVWNLLADMSSESDYKVVYGRRNVVTGKGDDMRTFGYSLLPRAGPVNVRKSAMGGRKGSTGWMARGSADGSAKGPSRASAKVSARGSGEGPFNGSAKGPYKSQKGRAKALERIEGREAEEAVRITLTDRRLTTYAYNIRYPVATVWRREDGDMMVFWHSAEFYSPRGTWGVKVILNGDRIVGSKVGLGPT